jgi:hypothetical protein
MIGSLFDKITIDEDYEKYKLNDEELNKYKERGSIDNLNVMSQEALIALRDSLTDIVNGRIDTSAATGLQHETFVGYEGKEEEGELIYFQGAWMLSEVFHDIIYNPRITVPVSQLLGVNKVRFLHDQFFYKPARHGTNISWHQDFSYWQRTGPENHMSVWIPLDDASVSNGTLQVIPGSQNWPLLPTVDLAGGDMDALKEFLTLEQQEQFKAAPITMPASCVEMHGSRVVHGSMPNKADIPRRALVLNYMAADTISKDGSQPIMPGFPVIPEGEVISGDGFPIVLDLDIPTKYFN